MHGMPRPDAPTVLAIVQAGGQGSRMDVLTRERAKPALPFAGSYHLVDVALSNLANSGVDHVWVCVQYQAASLDGHLQSGRPWDLDRNHGGYRRMVPDQGTGVYDGFSTGNGDMLYRIIDQIRALDPDLVVTVSADQVFRLDLRAVILEHLAKEAVATVVTTKVSRTEAKHKAVVSIGADGAVSRIVDKPDKAASTLISAEIVVLDTEVLLETLEELRDELSDQAEEGDTGLGDLAEHVLPRLVTTGRVHPFELRGYWKDMGRPETYLAAHRDLVRGRVDIFDDPHWRMRGNQPDIVPARVRDGAEVSDSILAAGSDVAGTVRRSVLGPGVVVQKGAVVTDSVIFTGTVVEAGAVVATSIVDEGVRVRRGARVGATPAGRATDATITLVGGQCDIPAGAVVEAGGRLEPGTTR